MSAELHALIHSLSKAEKKQLRLQGRFADGENANYLQLFDALLAQEAYDGALLLQEMKALGLADHFAVSKAYLRSAILRACTQQQAPRSMEAHLRRAIDEIEFLIGKGLDGLAQKTLEKALKLARALDLPAYKAELLRWMRRLANKNPVKGQAEVLLRIENEEILAIEQQLLDAKLRTLRAKVQALYVENVYARTAEVQAKVLSIQAEPILNAEPAYYSFQARQTLQSILSICHRMFGKDRDSLQCLLVALQAWEGEVALIRTYPDQYLQVLVSFLDSCLGARDFDAYLKHALDLVVFEPASAKLQARSHLLRIHLDLRYALLTGDFAHGLAAGQLAAETREKYAQAYDPSIAATMLYNLSSLYFLNGDLKLALQTINQILNRQSTPLRQDIVDAARLLEMAIHLDLRNLDLVESLQRAMHRRLRLHPRSENFENILVRGLKKWWEAVPEQQIGILRTTYEEIQALEGAAGLIGRQEIMIWLQSKIQGLAPSQIIRRGI